MRITTIFLLGFLLLLPALAYPESPGKGNDGRIDGGDVLRPSRSKPSTFVWYLGLDAGVTYSMFSNGKVSFFTQNPYNPQFPLLATIDEGNGLGFYLGGTADFVLSDFIGIQLKLHYSTRSGSFDESTDTRSIHVDTQTGLTTVFRDEVDWSFNHFGGDLLLRVQVIENSLYALIGPSFASLQSNKAKLKQTITQPSDIYYTEAPTNTTPNQLKTASSDVEVQNLKSSRLDLKAGIGTWINISEDLFLTPEFTVSFPLSKMIDNLPVTPDIGSLTNRRIGTTLLPIDILTNKDFNMLTLQFTVGLRWKLGS